MKGFKEVPYSNLAHLYLVANGFYNNYEDIKKKIEETKGQISYDSPIPVAATNAFFAIELYLKLVYSLDYREKAQACLDSPTNVTQYPNEHGLGTLFDMLDEASKCKILKLVSLNEKLTSKKFKDILDENKDGFIEWRYIFEKKDSCCVNFQSLSEVLEVLRSYCYYCMDHIYRPKAEWVENSPHTSATMEERPIATKEDLEKLLGNI